MSDGNNIYPRKRAKLHSNSFASSVSSLSVAASKVKKTCRTVTVICVDSRGKSQLPTTHLNNDTMMNDGNYYCDVKFEAMDASSFSSFLKLNVTFGELYAKDYYLYGLP